MSKQHDGVAVDRFGVRISGTMDVDENDLGRFKQDATLVLAIVVTDDGATERRMSNGDLRRTDILIPSAMRVVTGNLKNDILDELGLEVDLDPVSTTVSLPPAAGSESNVKNVTEDAGDDDFEDDEPLANPHYAHYVPQPPQHQLGDPPVRQPDPVLAAYLREGWQ